MAATMLELIPFHPSPGLALVNNMDTCVETAACGLVSLGLGRVSEDRPRELCGVCREDDERGLTRGRK